MNPKPNNNQNPNANRTKVAVYNHTNEQQGCLIDGAMVVIPAGDGMGGPGQKLVTETVAGILLKELPGKVSLAPRPLDQKLAKAIESAPQEALAALCLDLLNGKRPKDVVAYVTENSKAAKAIA